MVRQMFFEIFPKAPEVVLRQKTKRRYKRMNRLTYMLIFAAALLPVSAFAQKDTVYVPDTYAAGGVEGTLNDSVHAVIHADSVNNTDNLSNTVFKLIPDGYYVLTGTITTPTGHTLEIDGPTPGNTSTAALPMVIWTSTGGVSTNFNFDCFGDVVMKNVWLIYANTSGAQQGTSLEIEDDTTEDISGVGEHATFDDVIFDYSGVPTNAGGAVTLSCYDFKGKFENCYFRNDIDTHLRYYGRALSFPYNSTGYHTDSVSFTNCTFANLGYVYMQEGNEYGDFVWFNHCTFLNIMMFPLESPWWHDLVVSNTIFVNP